ncbi:MAG: hypothetical protein WCR30_04180 [Clostridia bacterium]
MNKLKTLVAMQLKEKLDLRFLKSKKETLFKLLFGVIGLAVFTALVYFAFYASTLLGILSLTSRLPNTVIIFLFTIMQFLSIISCTLGLTKSLYFSGDNMVLLTLPCKPNDVFFSKIIVFYINELKKNFTFMLPVFLAFGMINSFSLAYYPILIVAFFLVSFLPVVVGAILSIPSMWVSMALRNQKYLQLGIFAVVAVVVIKLAFELVAQIPENFNLIQQFATYYWDIQNFLIDFANTFKPFTYLTEMIIGKTQYFIHYPLPLSSLITFGVFVLILAVGSLLVYFVARPLFFKMTSKPFEYKKNVVLFQKKNVKHSRFISSLKKELILSFRTPSLLATNLSAIFVLPLAIFLLNKVFASMDTRLLGQQMSISFNLLLILLILLANNTQVASLFSTEGKAMYLLKTKPATLRANMLAKLTLNFVLSIFSILLTSFILFQVAKIEIIDTVFVFITVLLINVSHILWSAELDIVNPQYNQYNNGISTTGSNPNETKSTLIAFIISFLFFAVSLFLFFENYGVAWQKLFFIALLLFGSRLYLFAVNAKVYFREM